MAELAEPVVSFLLENIGRLLVEEAQFLAGVSDQALQLESKLRLMLSLLRDADSRQDEGSLIREWISQSKDAAYDAQNALETYAFKVGSRRGKGITNFLKRCSCVLSECYMRHRVGSEIQNLHNRISELNKSFQEYGIRAIMERGEGDPSSRQEQPIRRMYSHVEEDDFVGLNNDVQLLVKHLTNEHEASHDNVLSICGMGGLGKTTIARKLYNHPDVRQHFDAFGWVSISQQWQAKDILQRILVKIKPETSKQNLKEWNDEQLVRHLYEIQQSKRCLIVLDDIWSTDAWNHLKDAFPTAERSRSKILLTTRITNVATYIGPYGFHHEPRLLSDEESWDLLQKKALKGRPLDPDFEGLGKEIARCCRGLPLAVVVIGGILATKHELNQWEFVHKNIKYLLEKGENIGQGGHFLKILALSYNDLPYQLKPCFLYLSIYPEDCDIETEELYQLWMAEGIVSKKDRIGDESMMDVAERYLGELVKRCMIQVSLKEGPALRKFESCKLHDLMRDLCLAKARDENFLKVVDYREENIDAESEDSNSSSSQCRRIVIFLNGEDASKYVPPEKDMMKQARSFTLRIFRGEGNGRMASTKFNNLKMLRALTIEAMPPDPEGKAYDIISTLIQIFKLEIGNLIHLRYLCLKKSVFLVLPSSLGNLQHLETLDLRGCEIILVRNVLCKMKNLRHLYLYDPLSYKRSDFFYDHLPRCCKLQLSGLTKLEILENLNSKYCVLEGLCKLKSLQVLKDSTIVLENDCEEIINFISDSQRLKEARLIFYLYMDGDFLNSEKWLALLDKLFCSKLCHLLLDGCLRVLPEYKTNFFQNLVELRFRKSRIETNLMGTLEKLPNLRSLWLMYDAFIGREMICSSTGFPRLTFLFLSELSNLGEWRVENGAMANLSRLEIEDCAYLEMIPDGLQFVRKLKELEIRRMPKGFCDRLRNTEGEKGEDFDKIRHVPSIVIHS